MILKMPKNDGSDDGDVYTIAKVRRRICDLLEISNLN